MELVRIIQVPFSANLEKKWKWKSNFFYGNCPIFLFQRRSRTSSVLFSEAITYSHESMRHIWPIQWLTEESKNRIPKLWYHLLNWTKNIELNLIVGKNEGCSLVGQLFPFLLYFYVTDFSKKNFFFKFFIF